jgi:putative glutamine amidotransferase
MSRPRILLSTSSFFRTVGLRRTDALIGQNYAEAVARVGGLPLLAPNLTPELAETYLEGADGLILTGGVDVDPELYGADPHPMLGLVDRARDLFEGALYTAARARGVPVLGICRGHQLINVIEGGTLHQHLPALPGTLQHEQLELGGAPSHRIRLEPGTPLAAAFGAETVRCNSFHHQAVDRLGAGLRAVAWSGDGIVEALESTSGSFVLGVQWHPEMSFDDYPEHLAPFTVFMEAVMRTRSDTFAPQPTAPDPDAARLTS